MNPGGGRFDVVVVGSGVAGLSTALAARSRGLRVAVLEKSSLIGGVSCYSSGLLWVATDRDTRGVDDALRYVRYVSGGAGDPQRMRAFVGRAREAVNWLRDDLDWPIQVVGGFPDMHFPQAPGSMAEGRILECGPFDIDLLDSWRPALRESPYDTAETYGATYADLMRWGGPASDRRRWPRRAASTGGRGFGVGLVGRFLHELLRRGVEPRLSTVVTQLELEPGGEVVGVRTAAGHVLHADMCVVIAAGGYASNMFLARQLEQAHEWTSFAPKEVTGDALRLGGSVGGAVQRIAPNLALMFGIADPASPPGSGRSIHRYLGRPHSIVVNRHGARFGDESFFQDLAAALSSFDRSRHELADGAAWLVFDDQYVASYGLDTLVGGPSHPDLRSANTVEDLATSIGVEPHGLARTIADLDASSELGADRAFGRGRNRWARATVQGMGTETNQTLGTIGKAPFYGLKLALGGMPSTGLMTDQHARLLSWNGTALRGIYCVGDAAAHTEYGVGYQAGCQLASALAFGVSAIRHACGDTATSSHVSSPFPADRKSIPATALRSERER